MTRLAATIWAVLVAVSPIARGDPPPAPTPPLITTCRDLRLLPPELAAEKRPVQFEATVIAIDPKATIFVQDETGGSYLNNPPAGNWQRGQRLRIHGQTYPGLYVTGVRPDQLEILGTAPLPTPTRVTADDLASGRWHYQFVEVAGIVRAVNHREAGSDLRLGMGSQDLEVRVGESCTDRPLVGATVTIRGLAAGAINDRRQLVRPFLKAQSFEDIAIVTPGNPEPFAIPAIPVAHLLRYPGDSPPRPRVKVRGVVTYHRPGEALGLRDGSDALFVESPSQEPLQPGDLVEVVGFPRMGAFRAALDDAEYRKVGQEPPPDPIPSTPAEILTGAREADLVLLEAELVEGYATPDGDVLALRAGSTRFRARCPSGTVADWPQGSVVTVTGICRAAEFREGGYRLTPVAFELWPRTPGDVRLVSRPTEWTVRRWLAILGAVAGIAAIGFAWAASLRRQVRRQTAVIREQSQREATLDERQRIAREVHDTLEQELVGLTLRLEATAATVPAGPLSAALDSARRLVGRIHEEVRGLIWDLRDESGITLAEAIRGVLANLEGTASARLQFAVIGDPWAVPAVCTHNLKRIAQEAVTNSLKHAKSTEVRVDLHFSFDQLRLTISDDGQGFPTATDARPGHFGLVGMRERTRKIGGELRVDSQPGKGVSIQVTLPRNSPSGKG